MELRQLLYFITCARCGSLTTAAEELYTTQPHVSMVIRELEKELGTRLFQRRSNGVELTEAGARVYGYAQDALRNAELFRSVGSEQREHSLRVLTNNSSNMNEKLSPTARVKIRKLCKTKMKHLVLHSFFFAAFRYFVQINCRLS